MEIRFALDIGVASVGWAVVNDTYEVLEAGANIFPCADSSKNADRRGFRQLKRIHRRKHTRIRDFEILWERQGWNMEKIIISEVLPLRVKGLKEELSENELYNVLRNELLHRGISYLEDAIDDTVSGSLYEKAIKNNQRQLEKESFPCVIQWERLKKYGKYRGNQSVNIEGKEINLSNVFTTASYEKEIEKILNTQKKFHSILSDEFCQQYIDIFRRKRKYYEGPGKENSRTDYGIYTTQKDQNTGEYLTYNNLFERLIGKCSVYPEEYRAAGASYTAQEFNLLNDLNNLTVNNRKLIKKEKEEIVEAIKTSNRIDVKKIIENAIHEKIDSLTGMLLDDKGKECMHKFEQYNLVRRNFEKNGLDFEKITRTDHDLIGEILTLNSDYGSILESIRDKFPDLSEKEVKVLYEIKRKNGSLFSKWQKLSLKAMNELIPDMYDESKNQMVLLTERKLIKTNSKQCMESKYINCNIAVAQVYNPVVVRSIRIAVRIVNALLKKYGNPKQIIVEMPRDKNDDEQRKKLDDMRKANERELNAIIKEIKEQYGENISDENFYYQKELALKLKLWREQDEKCVYSGKQISIKDLLYNPQLFQIDHIIPISISFDDSRNNKVLVYDIENQKKGNKTPYMYLSQLSRHWDFEQFKAYVKELYARKKIQRKKLENLLYMQDVTKYDVLKKFINRNINDTRYASRVILNLLQDYFNAYQISTTVRVIRGSFTHQMRKVLRIEKDREESYDYHAIDAILMCYSQMGYDLFYKKQSEFIDWETGEIVDELAWDKLMDSEKYQEIMYQSKYMKLRKNIAEGKEKIKYWHKVDTKPNRSLCNQTIRGTRKREGKVWKINKLNIYDQNDVKTLRNKIEKGKSSTFLMYQYDRKSWDQMIEILDLYRDSKTPFSDYEKETGDFFRKYSKSHNGPVITKIKYQDGELGSCIDISHKYGLKKGSKKVVLESLTPYRMDVYYQSMTGKYYLVGLKHSDLKFEKGQYKLNEEAYNKALVAEKVIPEGKSRNDLGMMGIEFCWSFYRGDVIEYEKNGEIKRELFWSRTMPKNSNYIETKPISAGKWKGKKQNFVGLAKTKYIKKIRSDILGNQYVCNKEKFIMEVDKS